MALRSPQSLHLLIGGLVVLLSGLLGGPPAEAQSLPNDSLFHKQWSLNPNLSDAHARVLQAWRAQTEPQPVTVAVIDTGIDWTHPDLAQNIWQNLAEDADGDGSTLAFLNGRWRLDPGDLDGIDQDNNGYIDDLIGWDFYENDNNPHDFAGHGTHLAGVIGAVPNNGKGIAGINPNVKLMALRTGSTSRNLSYQRATEAMRYARENGARVVNLSWGAAAASSAFYRELDKAEAANIVAVAGVGNDTRDIDKGSYSFYPAAYANANILAVAAHTAQGQLWGQSNYGYVSADITAPGDSIWSTLPNWRYGPSGGTSMATAVVTGVASLLLSQNPDLGARDVRQIMLSAAQSRENLKGKVRTGGHVDAAKAMLQARPVALRFEAEDFEFGSVSLGQEVVRTVHIYNVSPNERFLAFTVPDLAFEMPETVRIPAQDSVEVTITFAPKHAMAFEGSVNVNDGSHTYFLTVEGKGVIHPSLSVIKRNAVLKTHIAAVPVAESSPAMRMDTLAWANTGLAAMEWSLTNAWSSFFTVTPLEGVTAPGDTSYVSVLYEPGRLPIGQKAFGLTLRTEDPNQPHMTLNVVADVSASIESLRHAVMDWGDYDADGDVDLIMSGVDRQGRNVTLLSRNDGNGRFQTLETTIRTGSNRASIDWGDYDADGDLDVLIGEGRGGHIYRNDGNSSFVETQRWFTGHGPIKWGDYDADGDLDGVGNGIVVRNDGLGGFSFLSVVSNDTGNNATAWADYDDDGDLDFFTYNGNPGLYRNPGDLQVDFLHLQQASLADGKSTDIAWLDYNADGLLDVVVPSPSGVLLYRRDLDGSTPFQRRNMTSTSLSRNGIWGDFDNDGFWDLLTRRSPQVGNRTGGVVLYEQVDEGRAFRRLWNNDLADASAAAWADFDNDGDLDFALSSTIELSGARHLAVLHRNDHGQPNRVPASPTNARASADSSGIRFVWSPAQDAETPTVHLTYNLWVGTAPDSFNVLVPMADLTTGYRRVVEAGNAGTGTSHTLYHLPPGTYHWGVQAIDGQFAGSAFAAGEPFTVENDAVNISAADTLWIHNQNAPSGGGTGGSGSGTGGGSSDPSDGPDNPPPSGGSGDDDDDDAEGVREGGQDFPPDSESPYPIQFTFHPAYPNPFHTSTTLAYDLLDDAWVNLTVFNTLGRAVEVLVQRVQKAGRYTVEWDGTDRNGRALPVGVYYARLEANDFVQVRSFVRIR